VTSTVEIVARDLRAEHEVWRIRNHNLPSVAGVSAGELIFSDRQGIDKILLILANDRESCKD